MADYLINFKSGEDIKASEVNSNFQYLLDRISDSNQKVQNYLETQLNLIQSNLSSIQKTLQNNIDLLNDNLTTRINSLDNAKFTQKSFNLSLGKNNLKSYLPNDNKQYFVLVSAYTDLPGANGGAQIKTDIMTTARYITRVDGDYGRSSKDVALTMVPVGVGRNLTLSGNLTSAAACGYCRI